MCAKLARSLQENGWQPTAVSMEIKVWEDMLVDLLVPRVGTWYAQGLRGKDYIFYHLWYTCFLDKQNSRAVSLMPQQKQFMLWHFLLKDKSVRCLLYHGKIQQSKFSSQVQQEDKDSQKELWREEAVTDLRAGLKWHVLHEPCRVL